LSPDSPGNGVFLVVWHVSGPFVSSQGAPSRRQDLKSGQQPPSTSRHRLWPPFVDYLQDATEQVTRHGDLGHPEHGVAGGSDDIRADLDHLLAQRGQRPRGDFVKQALRPSLAIGGLNHHTGTTTAFIRRADIRVRVALSAHQISN
jgi:hypothetical protein